MPLPTDSNGAIIPNWGPASDFVAITKSDSTDLAALKIRGIYVGGTGDVIVRAVGSSTTITFSAVPVGVILPIFVSRVMAATTASNLVGLV